MSCYHPRQLIFDGFHPSGKARYKISKFQATHHPNDVNDPFKILVPCRKCIGCRLDYSRHWADRLMIELDHSKTAIFVTLTYSDENLTHTLYDENLGVVWATLVKRDLQLFNKRLREHFPDKKIRFYAVGEYGEQTLRPHYHGIYYGLSLDDFPDRTFLKFNKHHQPLYDSATFRDIWQNGHISLANVSWQSCAYVARYNLKKLAQGKDDFASSRGCIPEFSLMSRKPGIAGFFFDDHPDLLDNPRDDIFISDIHGVKKVNSVPLPSYLFKKLELANPELYAIIKEEKKEDALDRFLFELEQTDVSEIDYLKVKERLHEKSAKLLKRPLDS